MTDGTEQSLEQMFNSPTVEDSVDSHEEHEVPQEPIEQEHKQEDTGVEAVPPTAKQGDPLAAFKAKALDENRKRQAAELRVQQLEAERNQWLQSQQPKAVQEPKAQITPDQFNTYEDYLAAVADERAAAKAKEIFEGYTKQQEERQQQYQIATQTAKDVSEMARVGAEKYQDFAQVVGSPDVPISEHMMNCMLAIDGGHDVAYQLGMNPNIAAHIARMPPSSQARAIGELAKSLRASSTTTPQPVSQPVIPKTLTQTRSASGQFTNKPWAGATPLDQVFSNKY